MLFIHISLHIKVKYAAYVHVRHIDVWWLYLGRLLAVETVSMPVARTNHVISHVTRWHDNIDVDSAYAFTLRVFTITDQHHHLHLHHHHQQQQQQDPLQLHGPLKPVVGLSSDETTSSVWNSIRISYFLIGLPICGVRQLRSSLSVVRLVPTITLNPNIYPIGLPNSNQP